VQYLKVFKYLVQYLVFKYYLNTAQSEVFHKVFKYSGQSICPKTDLQVDEGDKGSLRLIKIHTWFTEFATWTVTF